MITVNNVSFAHGEKEILRDINLYADTGKITAIMGCNGAGKTTLMRLLCAELKADDGTIFIDGKNLADWNDHDLALRRAVMTQNSRLSFSFSAVDVVLLGRLPVHGGAIKRKDAQIAYDLLELVDATDLAEQDFLTLSGGEQQRVQMARALAQIYDNSLESLHGKYLLLDEPNAGLDIKQQDRMLSLVQGLSSNYGLSVVIIIHDCNLAAQFADAICLLHNGGCLAFGLPWEVLTSEHIQQAFGIGVEVCTHPYQDRPIILNSAKESGGSKFTDLASFSSAGGRGG